MVTRGNGARSSTDFSSRKIDPALGSFEVFELTANGTYARVLAAIPGCEALVLDLDALWSELAELPER